MARLSKILVNGEMYHYYTAASMSEKEMEDLLDGKLDWRLKSYMEYGFLTKPVTMTKIKALKAKAVKKLNKFINERNEDWLKKESYWINHLDEVHAVAGKDYCAYFYNNNWGDRGDPHCSKIKDIDWDELYPMKQNIFPVGNAPMMTLMKVGNNYYNFADVQMLREKYGKEK